MKKMNRMAMMTNQTKPFLLQLAQYSLYTTQRQSFAHVIQ
nr:MAG TPA: hypothetical protein [Caudoviricetes sp.]